MRRIYNQDLAYIHDVGFGDFIDSASREFCASYRAMVSDQVWSSIWSCGSGALAATLSQPDIRFLG